MQHKNTGYGLRESERDCSSTSYCIYQWIFLKNGISEDNGTWRCVNINKNGISDIPPWILLNSVLITCKWMEENYFTYPYFSCCVSTLDLYDFYIHFAQFLKMSWSFDVLVTQTYTHKNAHSNKHNQTHLQMLKRKCTYIVVRLISPNLLTSKKCASHLSHMY